MKRGNPRTASLVVGHRNRHLDFDRLLDRRHDSSSASFVLSSTTPYPELLQRSNFAGNPQRVTDEHPEERAQSPARWTRNRGSRRRPRGSCTFAFKRDAPQATLNHGRSPPCCSRGRKRQRRLSFVARLMPRRQGRTFSCLCLALLGTVEREVDVEGRALVGGK
jgi:hypothetical protein